MVVTLGKQAAKAVRIETQLPLLILPHPASRLVTNALYQHAATILANGFTGVIEIQQLRGDLKTIIV